MTKLHAKKYDKFGLQIPGDTLCGENRMFHQAFMAISPEYINCKKCLAKLKK